MYDDSLSRILEKYLDENEENQNLKDELNDWTESLVELATIEKALELDAENTLHGKTILDIGTNCIKSLYIALNYEPKKIVGLSDELPNRASDIEQRSRLLLTTELRFYDCNFFDEITLEKILTKEGIKKGEFTIVLVSKTLHHMRFGKRCVTSKRNKRHKCDDSEKECIYSFEAQEVFEKLLEYGKTVVVYEGFWPDEDDNDKSRGSGYFTRRELEETFDQISKKFKVELIAPIKHPVGKTCDIGKELRKVDFVCFSVKAFLPEHQRQGRSE